LGFHAASEVVDAGGLAAGRGQLDQHVEAAEAQTSTTAE
jgi:hypothetical protein